MNRSPDQKYHDARARQHRQQADAAPGAEAQAAHTAMAEHHDSLTVLPNSADVSAALNCLPGRPLKS